tara:strand:- start:7656 stop:7919 length:264 start_codon:yes stop_codon:yes gene_type:complete
MYQVTEDEFRALLAAGGLADAPCMEVVDQDGRLVFTAIIRPEQAMRTRVAGIASQIDAGRARTLPDLEALNGTGEKEEVATDPVTAK